MVLRQTGQKKEQNSPPKGNLQGNKSYTHYTKNLNKVKYSNILGDSKLLLINGQT